jgi:branched-subunit amino acid permease
VQHTFGGAGSFLLAALIFIACLVTAVGLTCACAELDSGQHRNRHLNQVAQTKVGDRHREQAEDEDQRAIFGGAGSFLLAALIFIACLVTAVGLTCACAEFFAQYLPAARKRGGLPRR